MVASLSIPKRHLASTESRLYASLLRSGSLGASSAELAEVLWPTSRPEQWRVLLQFHIGVLASRLPEEVELRPTAAHDRLSLHFAAISPRLGTPVAGLTGPSEAAADLAARLAACERALVLDASPALVANTITALSASPDYAKTTHRVYGDGAPLGPLAAFAACFGAVRSDLFAVTEARLSVAARAAWRLITECLNDTFGDQQQRLIVEDAHLLDSHSLELLSYLAAYPSPRLSQLIVFGDASDTRHAWQQLVAELTTSDFVLAAA